MTRLPNSPTLVSIFMPGSTRNLLINCNCNMVKTLRWSYNDCSVSLHGSFHINATTFFFICVPKDVHPMSKRLTFICSYSQCVTILFFKINNNEHGSLSKTLNTDYIYLQYIQLKRNSWQLDMLNIFYKYMNISYQVNEKSN